MTEMLLAVRITADGTPLVRQLSQAKDETANLKRAMSGTAGGADELARSTQSLAQAQRAGATEARAQAAAQAETARAARTAAAEQRKQEQAVLSSLNRQRQGYQQAGFQVQDFFTQIAAGTSPIQAFAQQSGQFAQSLQIIGGEATGAKGKMAAFAGFLAGPWGIALGVALPLVTLLVSALFDTGSAADEAKTSSIDFTDALEARRITVENFAAAVDQLSGATRGLINAQSLLIDNTRAFAAEAITNLDQQIASLDARISRIGRQRRTGISAFILGQPLETALIPNLQRRRAELAAQRDEAQRSFARAQTAFETRQVSERGDPIGGERARIERERAALQQRRAYTIANESSVPVEGRPSLPFISEAEFQQQLRTLDRRNAELEQRQRVANRTGRNRQDRSAEVAARRQAAELERVRDFGLRAADAVARINDRWSEQPSLIQQANEATRDLNAIIREAQERLQTRGLGATEAAKLNAVIADARSGLTAVQDGLTRPFREMVEAADRQQQLQLLVVQGREREAEVLARIQRLQDQGVTVTAEQRAELERVVANEERINALLDKRDAIIGAYQQSLGDLRSSLEDLFSGGSLAEFGRNLVDNARRLRGRLLVEQLFGDGFRNLEQQVRRQTGLEGAVNALDLQTRTAATAMGSAGDAATSLANSLSAAAAQTSQATTPFDSRLARDTEQFLSDMQQQIDRWWRDNIAELTTREDVGDPIVVTASPRPEAEDAKGAPKLISMRPQEYFREVARVLASPIIDALARLDETLGTRLAGRLGGVIQGGIEGYLSAGPVGGVLGALGRIGGLPKDLNVAIDKAFKGAQTGQQIDQLFGALGIKSSNTGATLGGALGGAIGGPVGEIVGSILGGIVGGALKSAKRGSATITNVTGDASVRGNNRAFEQQAAGLASTVQDTLANIAEQFGGQVGNFAVSIGVRDGNVRVDPSGRGITKTRNGALDFGEDSEAALRAAILDAISDGGISGISAAIEKALNSSKDLDRAVREALKVQAVEDIIGGLGSTLERQFRQFEAQAKDRVRIATEYGFDVVKIEERNAEDRKKLVDQLLEDRVGSLQQLLKDFSFGDLFEGSAADRRAALESEINAARSDAEAGIDGAAGRLADLLRQRAETSREAFGTAGPEFASDRADAISSAQRIIEIENERIRLAQETASATRAASEQTNVLLNEQNDMLAQLLAQFERGGGVAAEQIRTAIVAADVSRQVQP